jgi:hypothetical protein
MKKKPHPIDPAKLRTISVHDRATRVQTAQFAKLPEPDASAADLLESFPGFLGADSLRRLVRSIAAAHRNEKHVVFAMGGHVIKVGCSPIVIDLMRRGVVTALSMNGATAVHDVETALFGRTSEDVAEGLDEGLFGMVKETPGFLAEATQRATKENSGLGRAIGDHLLASKGQHVDLSILAEAARLDLPATVHVAIGTDTIHMHANADGAAIGAATMHDFKLIAGVVADLDGGVWCNIGSSVILPEVFLKAVSMARNLGANLDEMTTANLDMLDHYRPRENVLRRPAKAGRSVRIIGHHEISLPLLRMAVLVDLDREGA